MTVVLADDQILFVESLKSVLESRSDGISVVGVASNGNEAVELVKRYRPDIALLDVRMPVRDGVEAAKQIHEHYPDVQTVMLTTFDDDEYVVEALRYGAVGYLLKNIPPKDLITSLHAIAGGAVLISPEVAQRLVDHAYQTTAGASERDASADHGSALSQLTEREEKILRLIADGYNNRQIGGELFLAEQTVKNYVSQIYAKLGVHNRIHLMKVASKGLGSTRDSS
ncbi:MAG: response regulator [Spirochaetota bacterium]